MADSDWLEVAERVEAIYKAAFGSTAGAAYQATLDDPPATAHTIADTSFYIRKKPWDVGVTHPACFLVPTVERIDDDTNRSEMWHHGIQVFLTKASNRNLTSDHDRLHFLRELAISQFLSQRIGGLTAWFVKVEPQGVIDDRAFAKNYDSTTFVLRCTKRKQRPTQAVPA